MSFGFILGSIQIDNYLFCFNKFLALYLFIFKYFKQEFQYEY